MSWIRRTPATAKHTCELPMREQRWKIPASWLSPDAPVDYHAEQVPDGSDRDLWRCDTCGLVWIVRHLCFICRYPAPENGCVSPGHVLRGLAWVHASWWQQWKHRFRESTAA